MSGAVKDTDHGYAALVARVFAAAQVKPKIAVGVLEDKGGEPHGEDAAITVLEIAVLNEFGTEDIPARSFIRAWFDEHESELREDLRKLMVSVVEGKRTSDQILELLGQKCVGQIQERIAAGIEPPNAPSTIRQKGSSTPLEGKTGILRSSVSYRVENR